MKNRKILIFIIMFLIFTISITTIVLASGPIDNPNSFDPRTNGITSPQVVNKANSIVGTITTVGIVISVIALIIIGLKYMMGSVEEKAEYKKTIIPYIIGIALLLSSSTIVKIIAKMTAETF